MKMIVGLGNPGAKYLNNRHNVGHILIDSLAKVYGVSSYENKFEAEFVKIPGLIMLKPMSFMNRSGIVVSEVASFYKIEVDDLFVVHDDLDIKLSEYKIQNGIGPKVHNGVNSVESSLGNKNFWRVRIGVDNRPEGEARTPGEEYVLENFLPNEIEVLKEVENKVIKEMLEKLK